MTFSNFRHITFLGSANWSIAIEQLQKRVMNSWGDMWKTIDIPFGQYRMQLVDKHSTLRTLNPDICVFCERIEDLLPNTQGQYHESLEQDIHDRFEEYITCIREARNILKGVFFIFDIFPVKTFVQCLNETAYNDHASLAHLSFELNKKLISLCSELEDCHLLPLSTYLQQYGSDHAWSLKYWSMARIPYAPEFSDILIECVINTYKSLQGKNAKVLVLDLDNTLWGGVIGDDGLSGIQLGSDYPGNIYVAVQYVVKALSQNGVVLALCSKNTDSIALDAINSHPYMVLRQEDFIVTKINWYSKSDNIKEIANEIGVDLSAVCFIDDSPYEREEVRTNLPDVIVPELPEDVAEYADFIARLPCFTRLSLTQADKERTQRYHVRKKVLSEQSKFSSKNDYLKSLDMKVDVSPISQKNKSRLLQLIAKTNQFNTTTHRHTEADLSHLMSNGAEVFAISLRDKYSEQDIIGVIILYSRVKNTLEIESFILSCRVLGRGIETGVLAWVYEYAKQHGYDRLCGIFTHTERNKPAATLYTDHNFICDSDGKTYILDMNCSTLSYPDWLEVSDDKRL